MKLYQIDDAGSLFISPALESWQPLTDQKITTVFDVDPYWNSPFSGGPCQSLLV